MQARECTGTAQARMCMVTVDARHQHVHEHVPAQGVPTWKGVCSAMRITSAGTVPCATATAPPIMCRIWCSAKAAP